MQQYRPSLSCFHKTTSSTGNLLECAKSDSDNNMDYHKSSMIGDYIFFLFSLSTDILSGSVRYDARGGAMERTGKDVSSGP